MKTGGWLFGAAVYLLAGTAIAEELTLKPFPSPPPLSIDQVRSETIVLPERLEIEADELARCAAAEARGEPLTLGCSELRLQRRVAGIPPVGNIPPLDARSPEVKLGVVNETALKQQLGPNYGIDTKPFRPNRQFGREILNNRSRTAPPAPPPPSGSVQATPPSGSILNRSRL
jgi:hypothetical protein